MKNEILLKVIDAIIEIKNYTNQNPHKKFYIGKTNDFQRREREHLEKGYKTFKVITKSSSIEDINELEQALIKFSRIFYKELLENIENGGEGNVAESPIYYIYLISK